jgi:hypothetical protein
MQMEGSISEISLAKSLGDLDQRGRVLLRLSRLRSVQNIELEWDR